MSPNKPSDLTTLMLSQSFLAKLWLSKPRNSSGFLFTPIKPPWLWCQPSQPLLVLFHTNRRFFVISYGTNNTNLWIDNGNCEWWKNLWGWSCICMSSLTRVTGCFIIIYQMFEFIAWAKKQAILFAWAGVLEQHW